MNSSQAAQGALVVLVLALKDKPESSAVSISPGSLNRSRTRVRALLADSLIIDWRGPPKRIDDNRRRPCEDRWSLPPTNTRSIARHVVVGHRSTCPRSPVPQSRQMTRTPLNGLKPQASHDTLHCELGLRCGFIDTTNVSTYG